MRKSIYTWLLIAGIATLIVSCQPTLETVPIEQQTLDLVFDSQDSAGVQANRFLYDMYIHIPSIYNRVGGDFLGSATDDAISSNTSNTSVQQLAQGTYSSNGYPDDQWANEYAAIRQANIFINNIDRVPLIGHLSNGTPMNRVWKAEAKFLRALCYWELVKRYGGVPILGDTVFQLGDKPLMPRNSFADCINYIVSQCNTIEDSLRPDPIDPAFIEMPTKAAAMALKARVLLYAASPLYNGGNIDPGNNLTGYTDYSVDRWEVAADAAKAIIDLGVFSLDTTSFNDVFITQNNNERIFARQEGNGTNVENQNGPVGYTTQINNGRTSPTQELVDAFGMANGKPITDPSSGYDPQNPYANRDPRLYATVFYNGAQWMGRPVETFEGGLDKPGGTRQQTRTGYYLRKFMGDFENTNVYSNHSDDDILFRYAEVLLNYAEALNEYLPAPNQDVYNAVEAIRKRAGLDPYQLASGLSRDQMRAIIHNERRKELAFEDQRYYDIRRWKEADTVFNKTLHEEIIYQLGSGQLTYQAVPILNMVFESPKMYFAPIPYSEVAKNRNMVQNPGW